MCIHRMAYPSEDGTTSVEKCKATRIIVLFITNLFNAGWLIIPRLPNKTSELRTVAVSVIAGLIFQI